MNSTTLHINAEARRFRKNEELVTALGEALNNPAIRRAMVLVRDMAAPKMLPDVTPGVHHDTTIAHHVHFLMGVSKGLDMLHKLAVHSDTDTPDSEDDPEREEFEDYAMPLKKITLPPVTK